MDQNNSNSSKKQGTQHLTVGELVADMDNGIMFYNGP